MLHLFLILVLSWFQVITFFSPSPQIDIILLIKCEEAILYIVYKRLIGKL